MRKAQKRQAQEFVELLHQAHEEIKTNLDNNLIYQALELLVQCQEGAIQLGEFIEKVEKVDAPTISLLEKYCNLVFSIHEDISSNNNTNGNKAYKKLRKAGVEIENSVNNDIRVKRVAVFLPYKASMWDSLESVWKAASQDEDWETFVIPIPYFNKNIDGSLGEMKYEGKIFPSNISIINWLNYSLEEEHPDIIFIHNPYDEFNYVTSIHPDFYSSKIKRCTDKLIYIPYFVHQNDVVHDYHCILPGVINADIVILQSEKVRHQYITYFLKYLPDIDKELGEKIVEKKFQALGSPKFDTGNLSINNIPDGWKPFLEKGNKKVVLFNTHLRGIMANNSEQFLTKLKWAFDFFKEKKDMVLLWRPHPLMVDTAKAMNPKAVEPYLNLVEYYKKENIGIFDDSTDLHRAINLSDAYYGDRSSVVELFKQKNKPILIMDHTIVEEAE